MGSLSFWAMCRTLGRSRRKDDAPGKMPKAAACGRPAERGLAPRPCAVTPVPSRPWKRQGVTTAGKVSRSSRLPYMRVTGEGGTAAASAWRAPSATGPVRDRRAAVPCGPAVRSPQGSRHGRRPRPPGKERLFAVGACHLRAFGLWKLVHRSTLRQRPGVPGNALRRIFRCLPVMGPGAASGRVAGSGPVWKITTLLED